MNSNRKAKHGGFYVFEFHKCITAIAGKEYAVVMLAPNGVGVV